MTTKTIVFDMDGTIADFYGVKTWLEDIKAENARPYEIAKPLYDISELALLIADLKENGFKVVVTTWLAKDSTKEYKNKVRIAKRNWLKAIGFEFDEIHLVAYGTTKANCTRKIGGFQVLVDDNEQVRKGWRLGKTIDANKNILPELRALLV